MKVTLAVATCLLVLHVSGCRVGNDASHQTEEGSGDTHNPAVEPKSDVSLRLVRGMTGLVPDGDELMIMVFGDYSTYAGILAENTTIGERSLRRYLQANPSIDPGQELLRIPDMEDESGSRFFYYEATSSKGWKLIAVCAGAWVKDPNYPPVCSLYYRIAEKTISYQLEEAFLVRNHAAIAHRVFQSLGYGVRDLDPVENTGHFRSVL